MTTPPKSPPPNLAIRAKPRPVTRLNRRTLIALAGVSLAAVLGAMIWALQGRDRSGQLGDELYTTDRVNPAEGLQTLPRDYTQVQPPQLGAPLPGELGGPIVRTEREAGIPAMPERPNFRPDPEEDARRAARLREQQEAEAAAKAAVFFQSIRPRQDTPASGGPAEPSRLDLTAIPAPTGEAIPAPVDDVTTQNMQDRKQAFVDREVDQDIYGSGTLQTPRSPYQVMAGTIIPAALVTGINSDLPGQIVGTVTENVYDTAIGRHLLIPQGARLIGEYDSGVAFGQSRVLLVWSRIVMPDGSSIVLDRLSGVDTAGYAGLEDEVDNHWFRLIGGAVLSSLLGIGAELAAPDTSDGDGDRIIIATRDGAQETINDVGQQITRRNLNIQPTLKVRPGFPVRVIVNKDLILRPYQAAPLTANIGRDD
ncbi:TrbI/VirB10 family protein [Aquamicrobium sp. LC103]|uniref:TrbI/VirB10 family protein n=1 Tax=Aquamicrobium sp. LC103 TaxID=1120658 RepID=UPI00063EC808|nr:TrbI/VirB10 family protein [Aquamicrobium sp. LC103]TKT82440.1 TrbI/VirB10 family protein [Aquamicrobium sp. LC103]